MNDEDDKSVLDEFEGIEVDDEQDEVSPDVEDKEPEDKPEKERVSFDEEQDDPNDTEAFRRVRQANRDNVKRIKELERQLATQQPSKEETLGAKPTLEASNYDTDAHEAALEAWIERKHQFDQRQKEKQKQQQAAEEVWNSRRQKHAESVKQIDPEEWEDADASVQAAFSPEQVGLVLAGSRYDSAQLFLALGNSPKKLGELAAIKDPVEFLARVVELEVTALNKKPGATRPAPERSPRGSASVSGVSDSKLARLEKEADRTGDRTELRKYRQQLRTQAK